MNISLSAKHVDRNESVTRFLKYWDVHNYVLPVSKCFIIENSRELIFFDVVNE